MGDQFRYESGLRDRLRYRDGLRKRCGKTDGILAITGNPTQRAGIANVVVSLDRQTTCAFISPVCVGEPVRMLMRWIAIVDVQERSLRKGQQEAGGYAKMQSPEPAVT